MSVPQAKPSTPPPAYAVLDPSHPQASTSHHQAHTPSRPISPYAPAHPGWGPTPITQQQAQILPYYDPRSPYAMAEASVRARWRFIGAMLWAIIVLTGVSLIMGLEVELVDQPWRGNGRSWRSGQWKAE